MKPQSKSSVLREQAVTFVALLVNPFFLVQVISQCVGQCVASLRLLTGGHTVPLQWAVMQLPFQGRWNVLRCGSSEPTSHSWWSLSQRYAGDFTKHHAVPPELSVRCANTEFVSFGQELLAPVSGVVVQVEDRWNDNSPSLSSVLPLTCRSLLGNHIIIRPDAGSFLVLLAHLQRGSCVHKAGARVASGDYLGRCGNSGLSTEPHLHMQVLDRPNFFTGRGIPFAFERVAISRADSEIRFEVGAVQGGDVIQAFRSGTDSLPMVRDPLPPIGRPSALRDLLVAVLSFFAVTVGVATSYYHLIVWVL